MLDQNTDRMWYVIGAVIIGAALIFLMNGTFPTLFANIGGAFEEKVGETTEMVGDINPNPADDTMTDGAGPLIPFSMDNVVPWNAVGYESQFERISDTVIRVTSDDTYRGGVKIPAEFFEEGKTYTVTFGIQKVSGTIEGLGGHAHMASEADVLIDGKKRETWTKGSVNSIPYNQWSQAVVYPDDTNKHTVSVTFTKDKKVYDNAFYIQPNRTGTTKYVTHALAYDVLIDNVRIREHAN